MPEGGRPNFRPGRPYSTFPSGDPRWVRLRRAVSGGPATALSLPTVITVGINGVSATTANVIGSVDPNGFSGPWSQQAATNYVSDPSFEYDTLGAAPSGGFWSTALGFNGGGSPAQTAYAVQSSWSMPGGYRSLRMTATGVAAGTSASTTGGADPGTIPAAPGQAWSLQAAFNVVSVSTTPFVTVSFCGASGPITGTTTLGTSTTGVQTITANNAIAPVGTTYIQIALGFVNNLGVSSGVDGYLDTVMLSQGATAPAYVDGDTAGYGWASTTGQTATVKAGTWAWFTYGTSLPLPSALVSPPTFLSSGTVPSTTTYGLAGLTSGQTYYAAAVAQNANGTVYGQTLSFVAQTVTQVNSQPVVPYGQTAVAIPHFNVPFALVTTGTATGANVVEQDTSEDVLACVNAIVECPVGSCPQLPTFGIPLPTFAQEPVDTTEMVAAIQALEPRATVNTLSQLLPDKTTWGITLDTSTTSSGQLT